MSSESGPDRRKRMTTAVSIFNRLSGASASMRSRGSSLLSKFQRDVMGFQDSDAIRCREWLLISIEFLLAFSWNCFLAREKSQRTMEMRGKTPRQESMESLFWLGWASIGNIIVGQLMDSLTGHYFMALLNVAVHFMLASVFLIGEIVHETSSEDVYAPLLSHVFLWSVPPIKALGFTRYVYAMDQSGGKGASFIVHYTFIYYLFSLLGHFLFTVLKDSTTSFALLSAIAFCFNGTALFMLAYLVRPRPFLNPPPSRAVALKVWGVLFTALRNRRKFGRKIIRQDWLDYAESRYDKGQIIKTRRLFRVFLMASPTAGFLLFTTNREVIFKEFYDNLKLSGRGVPKYYKWILPTASSLVVVGVEYGVIPLLRACKIKVNFLKRFLLGYTSLVLAVLIAAVITSITEKLSSRRGVGTMRVYNTMTEGNISFVSKQEDFTQLSFHVIAKKDVSANFQCKEQNLFRMAVSFTAQTEGSDMVGNMTSYTQLFSVAPQEVLQYVAIAPTTIIRVLGFLPVKQGPPGKNDRWKPRCFIVSFIRDRIQSVFVINKETEERMTIDIPVGKVIVFQVEEGQYELQYTSSTSQELTSIYLGAGGLYGIYLFLGLNSYEIEVDTIVKENTNHAMIGLAVSIPLLIARAIGQVSLDAFVYTASPDGLKGLGFGFYVWCAHLTAWFILIGFHTWHHYITPNIIVYYAVIAAVSFLLCLVLLIRYRNHYIM